VHLLVSYLNYKMDGSTIIIGWSLYCKQNVPCYVLNLVGNVGFQMVNVGIYLKFLYRLSTNSGLF